MLAQAIVPFVKNESVWIFFPRREKDFHFYDFKQDKKKPDIFILGDYRANMHCELFLFISEKLSHSSLKVGVLCILGNSFFIIKKTTF